MNNQNTDKKNQNYIFGPVPSRRLGRSLGVDLVPFKTCTYDCIYCQLGCTTNKTLQRQEWVPLDQVLEELQSRLSSRPDYITLSGSGEPTLYSRIGELIEKIKDLTPIPVAVLTNGSLLGRPEVRYELQRADLVIPSLDAGCDTFFQYVNRPLPEITFDRMVQGLIDFRKEYQGKYWLEVFLLGGVTSTEPEIQKLSKWIGQIAPDRVQINTVTRPPAESFAMSVPKDRLAHLAAQLAENAEIIADYHHVHDQEIFTATCENILDLLRRRPCSLEDIAAGLGSHRNEVAKYLEDLLAQGIIQTERQNNQLYYTIAAYGNTNQVKKERN